MDLMIPRGRRAIPLRLLLVEDSESDSALILLELRRGGFDPECTRVDSADQLIDALEQRWDVIVADYRLPGFSGLAALALIKERGIDVPVILASGVMGEDAAVEAMRAGACDYVLKRNLQRLPLAIARELADARMRHERRRVDEALRRQLLFTHALSSSLGEGVFAVDAECRLTFANPAAERMVGALAVQLRGLDLHEILGTPHAQLASVAECPIHQVMRARALLHREDVVLRCRDGTSRPIAYTASPLRRNAAMVDQIVNGVESVALEPSTAEASLLDGAVLAFQDISARKEAEAATQEAIRARDDFISIASHELRTPLTPLKLQTQRLLATARTGRIDAAQFLPAIEMVSRQIDRLNRLVANMLDVSRIIAGRLLIEREPVDLVALANEVVQRLDERARAIVRVGGDSSLVGQWDRLRIEQVVMNLLSNAIKYGEGRPVDITIARHGATASLSVRDRGIGVSPDQLDRIFGRFERAVSQRAFGGMGLGLYIVRQFVTAHGGTVHVDSEAGKGATFTIALPLEPPPIS